MSPFRSRPCPSNNTSPPHFTPSRRLRKTISIKLRRTIRRNRTRVDYQQEFQRLIDAYNAGSMNVRALFDQLIDLAQRLEEEEKRHIRENLTEEQLALFDILTRSVARDLSSFGR